MMPASSTGSADVPDGAHLIEIELKARVADVQAVAARLDAFMTPAGTVDKRDEYWSLPAIGSRSSEEYLRFRLRTESGSFHVTFKEKTMRGTVEVNRETEFAVDGDEAFKAFARRLGASVLYEKRKTGSAWRSGDVLAELVQVDGLGAFLEVETMRADEDPESMRTAISSIREVIERCGLGTADIEPRTYRELLGVREWTPAKPAQTASLQAKRKNQ